MILAIVVDTDGNEGTAYELEAAEPITDDRYTFLDVKAKVGEFPFSGAMLSAMLGLPTEAPAAPRLPITAASHDRRPM